MRDFVQELHRHERRFRATEDSWDRMLDRARRRHRNRRLASGLLALALVVGADAALLKVLLPAHARPGGRPVTSLAPGGGTGGPGSSGSSQNGGPGETGSWSRSGADTSPGTVNGTFGGPQRRGGSSEGVGSVSGSDPGSGSSGTSGGSSKSGSSRGTGSSGSGGASSGTGSGSRGWDPPGSRQECPAHLGLGGVSGCQQVSDPLHGHGGSADGGMYAPPADPPPAGGSGSEEGTVA
jgi:hypothetical protein